MCFYVWPGVIPNQRQLALVVSDWGSYLSSLLAISCCGILFHVEACVVFSLRTSRYVVLFVCLFWIINMYAFHAAPWSDPSFNERDRRSHQKWTKQRAQEQTSWTWEEILDGKGSWTWEEIQAGMDRRTWEETVEARFREEQQQHRRRRPRRKPERQPQETFWGG